MTPQPLPLKEWVNILTRLKGIETLANKGMTDFTSDDQPVGPWSQFNSILIRTQTILHLLENAVI